jgi:hypothetical protein
VETDSCGKYSFKYGRVLGMLSRGHWDRSLNQKSCTE